MATIASLAISLSASTAALQAGFNRGSALAKKFGKAVGPALSQGAMVGAAALTATTAALVALTKASADAIDANLTLAGKLGLTTESLVELQWAAQMSNVEAEVLGKGLQKMGVNIANAANGSKQAASALAMVGLEAKDLQGLTAEQQLGLIADKINELPDAGSKAAASLKIFGKAGADMLPVLAGGSAGLKENAEEARKLGLTYSNEAAGQVAAAMDSLDKSKAVFKGLGNSIAISVAPYVEAVANKFVEFATAGMNSGSIVSTALEWIASGIGIVADVIHTLKLGYLGLQGLMTKGITLLLEYWSFLGKGIDWVTEKLGLGKAGASDFFAAMAKDMDKLANNQLANFNKELQADPPSVAINKWFADIKTKAEEAKNAVHENKNAVAALDEETVQAAEDGAKLIDDLEKQIATFGMSAEAIKRYEIAQGDFDDATKEQANSLLDQLDALEAQKKATEDAAAAQEKLAEAGKSVFESVQTPMEQYEAKIAELTELLMKGAITQETFDRASLKAKQEMNSGLDNAPKFAGAMEFNSAEARSAILQHQFGKAADNSQKEIAKSAAQTVAEQKLSNTFLRQLAKERKERPIYVFN